MEGGHRVCGDWLIRDLDVVGEAGVKTLYTRALPATVEGGRLEVRFRANRDYAILNSLRLESETAVIEVPCGEQPLPVPPQPSTASKVLHNLYETSLGKLGSRMIINPRPQDGIWHHSPLGSYYGEYRGMILGTRYNGRVRILPFSGRYPVFSEIGQVVTPTSITYTAKPRVWPFEVDFSFRAPFCPLEKKLSTAPFMYLDVTIRSTSETPVEVELLVGQSQRMDDCVRPVEMGGVAGFEYDSVEKAGGVIRSVPQSQTGTWAWATDADDDVAVSLDRFIPNDEWRFGDQSEGAPTASSRMEDGRQRLGVNSWPRYSGITWNVNLNPGESLTRTWIAAAWVDGPILNVLGEDHSFRYHQDFDSLHDVVRYAKESRNQIITLTEQFESTIEEVDVSQSYTELTTMAFQTWLNNTWWCISTTGPDWFSVWEGVRKTHSAADVCHNDAPFYYQYWPELLRMQIESWPRFMRRPDVLAHDCGPDRWANGVVLGSEMPIEENANFILLLHHYWRTTGDGDLVRRQWPVAAQLLEFIWSCDADGDGFAIDGHYNTYEPASYATIGARKQTYLAMKTLASSLVAQQMSQFVGAEDFADRCLEHVSLVTETLENRAWLSDHFAVCLQQEINENQIDARTGSDLIAGLPIKGWGGYSTLTTMGLIYPLRSGIQLPHDLTDRIRLDVVTSAEQCVSHAGHTLTSHTGHIWFSQNMIRDSVAAYLGLDMLFNVEQYWKAQRRINQQREYVSYEGEEHPEATLMQIWREGGCWTDYYNVSDDTCGLERYPRGMASFGLVWALGRLIMDRVTETLSIAPLRWPTKIPLPMFADWQNGEIPWILCHIADGKPVVEVTHEHLLGNISVTLRDEPVRIW